MGDLYPTPTRLQLLRDIDAGLVVVQLGENAFLEPALGGFYDPNTEVRRKVTGQVVQLVNAGWVELRVSGTYLLPDSWVLTEAGRKVLEEADRG